MSLAVRIGRLELKNPVMVASGTFGMEYWDLADVNSLGAYVTKTVTLKGRTGNPPPRVIETAAGMLNSIGLENKGLDDFIRNKMPLLSRVKIPIIISIAGDDAADFKQLAGKISELKRIGGLELNLSCPNIRYGAREDLIAHDDKATYEVVKAVRKVTNLTVVAKLSPNVTDIAKIAKAAAAGGADAVTISNTFLGMAVDAEARRPRLGNATGGLSGPAIKPLSLRLVWEAHSEGVGLPIIGAGGIMDYKDALEFILCGATAIQVGSANFVDPNAAAKIVGDIRKYLSYNKIKDINRFIGALSV